jgi:hypothetical protein
MSAALSPSDPARAFGGDVARVRGADQMLAPLSDHSARDRSVSILFGPNLPDGLWITCFGNGDALVERARVRKLIRRQASSRYRRRERDLGSPRPSDASGFEDRCAVGGVMAA